MLFASMTALLLLATTGCSSAADGGSDESSSDTITIAALLATSGAYGPYGSQILDGAQFVVDQVNAEGGIDGKEIVLEVLDTQSDKSQAVALARRAGEDSKYIAILGPNDSESTLAVSPVAEQVTIPMVSPGASVPWPSEFNPWTFRVQLVTSKLIENMLPRVHDAIGFDSAAVVATGDAQAQVASAAAFKEVSEEIGVDLVASEEVVSSDTDLSAVLTRMLESDPEVIYSALLTEQAGLMMKQARELGFTGQFIGDLGIGSPAFYETGGEATNGAITGAPYDPQSDRPVVQDFITAFEDANDGTVPGTYEALGADGVLVIIDAIRAAGADVTRDAVREQLGLLKDVDGVTGVLSFDGPGDVNRDEVSLVVMQDGKYVPFEE
jgi:branched-chain amino acid transport system substrate-binding protein